MSRAIRWWRCPTCGRSWPGSIRTCAHRGLEAHEIRQLPVSIRGTAAAAAGTGPQAVALEQAQAEGGRA